MRIRHVALALVLCLSACKGKSPSGKSEERGPGQAVEVQPDPHAATAAGEESPGATPSTPAAGARPSREMRAARRQALSARADSLLKYWLSAQNQGDSASYLAMYDPAHFKGMRRTHNGKVNPFDFTGWQKDRLRMFKLKNMQVAAEQVEIATWLDPGSELAKGVVLVRFIQRWRGGKYADHGVKVLHFWLDRKDRLRIVYEDLLNSEPGWDRSPQAQVATLTWAPPASHEEAVKRWQELAITADNYPDKLARIPAKSALARGLAEALVVMGGYACTRTVDYGNCGIEELEFAPLAGKETFDDPCVRRRLLPWALDQLSSEQLVKLEVKLLGIVNLGAPEKAALGAVLDATTRAVIAAADAAEKNKQSDGAEARLAELSDVLVTLFDRADHARVPADIAGVLDDLPLSLLIRLSSEAGLEYAATTLADQFDGYEGAARAAVYTAMTEAVGDVRLSASGRMEILGMFDTDNPFDKAKLRTGLVDAAGSSYCPLAAAAMDALIALGVDEYRPSRPTSQNPGDYVVLLCMMFQSESDAVDADALWASLLPDEGEVMITHTVEDLDYEMWQRAEEDGEDEGDENGDDEDDEDDEEGGEDNEDGAVQTDTNTVKKADSSFSDLDEFSEFGEVMPTCTVNRTGDSFTCTRTTDAPDMAGPTDGLGPVVDGLSHGGSDNISITFTRGKDGRFYVSELDLYTATGCPC